VPPESRVRLLFPTKLGVVVPRCREGIDVHRSFAVDFLFLAFRSRVQEERKVIARRKAIGADLIESQALLENRGTRVMLIEGRLHYLRLVHRLRLAQQLR
jgi:hypothetical protein